MPILKIIITYKGKQFKKYIKLSNNELTNSIYFNILITHKIITQNVADFICVFNEEWKQKQKLIIPSTSLIPKESAVIHLDLLKSKRKFTIPIHSIYSLGQFFNTSTNINVDLDI